MITRSIDSDNDWNFGNGKSHYLSDNASLAQNIKTRLQSFIGDCFFDLGAGIDWFLYLGSKNLSGLKLAIGGVITSTLGVDKLEELSFSLDDKRQLLIQYRVTSVWSTTIISSSTIG